MKSFKKLSKVLLFTFPLITLVLSACSDLNLEPKEQLNSSIFANNFDLTNLKKKDLKQELFSFDLTKTNKEIASSVSAQLLYNWAKDFIADTSVDKGSHLYKLQKKLKEAYEKVEADFKALITKNQNNLENLQNELNAYGGSKEGFLIHKFGADVKNELTNLIFDNDKLYVSYERSTNEQKKYLSNQASLTEIDNPDNWDKIKIAASTFDLEAGNIDYQKRIANFQSYLFDTWFAKERPYLVWNIKWDYGTSALNNLQNLYNSNKLSENSVSLPSQPSFEFPAFDIGDGSSQIGMLNSFNSWQKGVKENKLVSDKTNAYEIGSDINFKKNVEFKIYTNTSLAQEQNNYLSSAIYHQLNKKIDSTYNLRVNEIDLSTKDWTDEQKHDPLFNFLAKEDNSQTKVAWEIDNEVVFNPNGKFAKEKFVYPLRDIKNNQGSNWTLVKTKEGINAVALEVGGKTNPTNLTEFQNKIKKDLLWRFARRALVSKKDNLIDIELAKNLKEFLKANIDSLILDYALKTADEAKTFLKTEHNDVLFFKTTQNILISATADFRSLLEQSQIYVELLKNQKNLLTFREKLGSGFNDLASKKVVVKENKNILSAYANGLATGLGFKRNLSIKENDPVFNLTDSQAQTFTNDGFYADLLKFYTKNTINPAAKDFGSKAVFEKRNQLLEILNKNLNALTLDKENVYYNGNFFLWNNLNINYAYYKLVKSPEFQNHLKNLYLANEIKFDYAKNEINFDFQNMDLSNLNINANQLNDLAKKSAQEILYSDNYLKNEKDNQLRSLLGGYKIETEANKEGENYQNYTNKIISVWNKDFYSFSDAGWNLSDSKMSNYVRTLYAFNWLMNNNYKNLLSYLQSLLNFNNYAVVTWAQQQNLNNNSIAGESQEDNFKNNKLKDPKANFKFVADPNQDLVSSFYSYNLNDTNNNNLIRNNSLQNFIKAKTKIKGTDEEDLFGFYGLYLSNNKNFGKQLPEVVAKNLFADFSLANPDGNLTSKEYNSNPALDKLAKSKGNFFGNLISGSSTEENIKQIKEYLFNLIKNSQTFAGVDKNARLLASKFPEIREDLNQVIQNNSFEQVQTKEEKEKNPLPPIRINLKQKKAAILNVLKGHRYEVKKDTNEDLKKFIEDFYNQDLLANPDFKLIHNDDLERFSGSLQNPESANTLFPELKYFLPDQSNSRIGYVTYLVQLNKDDVSELVKFKKFLNVVGMEGFVKFVLQIAQDKDVQKLALDSFVLSSGFKRIETQEKALLNLFGQEWIKLKEKE